MKLGRTQQGVLKSLAAHKFWYYGCGWHWNGEANTERVMDALVKRGLVVKAIEPILMHGRGAMVYRLTSPDNSSSIEL